MSNKNSPLEYIADLLLTYRPSSLSSIIDLFESAELFGWFVSLVELFTPDYKEEILCKPTSHEKCVSFLDAFEREYFPVDKDIFECGEDSYYELTRGIPVHLMSISWDEYEELPTERSRLGYRLMAALLESPFSSENEREVIVEACEHEIPAEVLCRIPAAGFRIEELAPALKGTEYEALSTYGSMLQHDTNNFFLDNDWEMMQGELPEWDIDTITALKNDWDMADKMTDKVIKLADWLEKSPRNNFCIMLDYLLEKFDLKGGDFNYVRSFIVDKRQLRFDLPGFSPEETGSPEREFAIPD